MIVSDSFPNHMAQWNKFCRALVGEMHGANTQDRRISMSAHDSFLARVVTRGDDYVLALEVKDTKESEFTYRQYLKSFGETTPNIMKAATLTLTPANENGKDLDSIVRDFDSDTEAEEERKYDDAVNVLLKALHERFGGEPTVELRQPGGFAVINFGDPSHSATQAAMEEICDKNGFKFHRIEFVGEGHIPEFAEYRFYCSYKEDSDEWVKDVKLKTDAMAKLMEELKNTFGIKLKVKRFDGKRAVIRINSVRTPANLAEILRKVCKENNWTFHNLELKGRGFTPMDRKYWFYCRYNTEEKAA